MSSIDNDAVFNPRPMPLLSITNKKTIEKCRNFPLLQTDIFICSYPKSGTTWLQHSIPPADSSPIYHHVSDYAPFFDIDAHWEDNEVSNVQWICNNHTRIGRRIFNTHLRLDMLPSIRAVDDNDHHTATGGCGGKFIYVVRSPLDTCASFYAHLSNQVEGGYGKSMEEFCVEWMNGAIPYGSWDDHVLSYMLAFAAGTKRKVTLDDGREFLLILHQEMVDNLSAVVDEVVDFLHLNIGAYHRTDLMRHFSFEYMRQHIDHFQPKSVTWKNQFKFLRGGRTGDGRRMISKVQQMDYARCQRDRNVQNRLSQLLTTNPHANNEVYCLIFPFFQSC